MKIFKAQGRVSMKSLLLVLAALILLVGEFQQGSTAVSALGKKKGRGKAQDRAKDQDL